MSLRSRVDFLEGLLAKHGIEVPPQQGRQYDSPLKTTVPLRDSQRRLEVITELFWGLDRLENCLSQINTDKSVSKHPMYTLVVQYTSSCLLKEIYSEECTPPPELDALQLKAARHLTETLCAFVNGKIFWPVDIGLVVAYMQLIATRWFWGMPLDMPADERMFLRTYNLVRGNDPSNWAMYKLFITTDIAIALVQDGHTIFSWRLDDRRRRKAGNDPEGLILQDPSLISIYRIIVSLIRCAGGSMFRQVSDFSTSPIGPDTLGQLASKASDLALEISGKIGKEVMRSNILTARQERHLAPQTTYAGPPHIEVEERQRLLWLKVTYIYAKSISRRVPLRQYRRLEDVLKLRSGIFEIPISSWEGKEWMLVWIMLPLICTLESPQNDGVDISEKNRRYCKALFLRTAQVYAAKNWSEAADFFADMRGFTAWLRKDPGEVSHASYQLVPIGPDDEIAIELR